MRDDFIFHLDTPREQGRGERQPLRGWITAQAALSDIRLHGRTERVLELEERPDVHRAFPNYPFAQGFQDKVEALDFREGQLHFSFAIGGDANNTTVSLPPPPSAAKGIAKLSIKLKLLLARQRLRRADDPSSRWNAALSALLLEVALARGQSFRREEADRLISLFADVFPEACVVQIGANDGAVGDPLFAAFSRTRWFGLLVEPVPHLYEKLVARYRDRPAIRLERAVVSAQDGDAALYRLRSIPGKTPEWFDQLATLNREVLFKHGDSIPEIESLLIEERVSSVRLETLLARHNISRIDLLVIDTEGHDYEILRTLDFARFRPVVLMFEHQHLKPSDKAAAAGLLETHGYCFREVPEGDTIAWRTL